jgi:hypothetical protein
MATLIEKRKLTVPQVARLWGVSSHKVIHFIRTGELKAINLAASRTNRVRYSIDLADIEAFELSRQVVPDGGLSTTKRLRRRAAANVKEFF